MKQKILLLTILGTLLPFLAFAETDTFYSTSGDGHIRQNKATWIETHDDTIGESVGYAGTENTISSVDNYGAVVIIRGFLPFDTSSIPDNATITSATLYLYTTYIGDHDNDGNDFIGIIKTTQANAYSLILEDYDQLGTIEGSGRLDLGNMILNSYNSYNLNSTGLSWIDKGGITNLGIREGHDILDDPIAVGVGANEINVRLSEYSGTDYDPKLVIEYTIPAPACGNNTIELGEVCDGTDLGGETCITKGFDSGTLACAGNCLSFDTTECSYNIPPALPIIPMDLDFPLNAMAYVGQLFTDLWAYLLILLGLPLGFWIIKSILAIAKKKKALEKFN